MGLTVLRVSQFSREIRSLTRAAVRSPRQAGFAGRWLHFYPEWFQQLTTEASAQGEFALHQNPRRIYALTPKGGQRQKFLL